MTSSVEFLTDMAAAAVDDGNWAEELKCALLETDDINNILSITKGKELPAVSRAHVWQVCLGIKDKPQDIFDEIFDLPEQAILRDDCRQLVGKLGNDEEDRVSIVSDLESVLTCYCKSSKTKYESSNGWLEILGPLLALKLTRDELYNCFHAIVTNFLPRDCSRNAQLFHLFRLLILYHDAPLCSFLDTKRIFPDVFASSWFRSLFAANCGLQVVHAMWDVYFQQKDPFFICFLALVILVNAKEQLLPMAMENKETIVDMLGAVPGALESEDVEDFCSLALYYYLKTPASFKQDYQHILFGNNSVPPLAGTISQALCLPVSVEELVLCTKAGIEDDGYESVRFFLVDCRPAEQYNSGHLPTAFHLDANLMLQEPQAFATAVQALFGAQKQAIAANSLAGGEHLCFMGSGREEEDQYVHMVIASFLQKHCQYVSIARGGYIALHEMLQGNLSSGLADHSSRTCIVCNSRDMSAGKANGNLQTIHKSNSLMEKLSSAVKSKSAEMKDKMVEFITNPNQQSVDRHVSTSDKVGKRYRNMASVFTIDDDHEEVDGAAPDEEGQEVVSIPTWLKKPDIIASFKCKEVKKSGHLFSCYLLVTESHLFVLRTIANRRDFAHIASRRALSSIVKITSKKRQPELITFKYGTISDNDFNITDLDLFLIPKASEATKTIKQQIMKLFDD